MLPNTQLKVLNELSQVDEKFIEKVPYMNMVGILRYAADMTRPNIVYVTEQLVRHLQKYSLNHLHVAKHVFSYLKGTADYWLILSGYKNNVI